MSRFLRMAWTNCPMPMLAVSPSPVTAMNDRLLLTMFAPVVTEGILPWTVLNPWLLPKK